MVTVVVFEFSVMRCQPLRRALAHHTIIMLMEIKWKVNQKAQCMLMHIFQHQ